MSDRLAELQRQRALLTAHLAWLDQEIASTQQGTAALATPSTQPAAPARSPGPKSTPGSAAPNPDALLAKYGNEPAHSVENVRKGCYIVFSLAFILLTAAVLALFFYTRWKHPAE
jgi:hypothetical protein